MMTYVCSQSPVNITGSGFKLRHNDVIIPLVRELSLNLQLLNSLTHTHTHTHTRARARAHTHTHTHREREREGGVL